MSIWQYFSNFMNTLLVGLNGISFFGVSILMWISGTLISSVMIAFLVRIIKR